MLPNRSRAGVPTVEMAAIAGVTVEMAPEQGAKTTGGSLRKVATATGPALDVGTSQAEPTPAAATPGEGAEDQILKTRATRTRTRAPTGATRPTNPILRVTARAGESQQRTTTEPRTGTSRILSPPTSGGKVPNPTCLEAIKAPTSPQVLIVITHPIRIPFLLLESISRMAV